MTRYDVTLIPGDGIGPEITAQTVKVLEATGLQFNWDEELAGMAAVEATGTPLPDATIESIRKNTLARKGPLTTPVGTGFRSVNVGLRKEFELFANFRPARTLLPGGRFDNVDIVLVRENLEGLYIGVEHFVQVGNDPRAVGELEDVVVVRRLLAPVRVDVDPRQIGLGEQLGVPRVGDLEDVDVLELLVVDGRRVRVAVPGVPGDHAVGLVGPVPVQVEVTERLDQ